GRGRQPLAGAGADHGGGPRLPPGVLEPRERAQHVREDQPQAVADDGDQGDCEQKGNKEVHAACPRTGGRRAGSDGRFRGARSRKYDPRPGAIIPAGAAAVLPLPQGTGGVRPSLAAGLSVPGTPGPVGAGPAREDALREGERNKKRRGAARAGPGACPGLLGGPGAVDERQRQALLVLVLALLVAVAHLADLIGLEEEDLRDAL